MDNQEIIEGEITKSPSPQKSRTDFSHPLTFPEAIKAVSEGKRITKIEWADENIYGFLSQDGHLKINLPDKLSDWILSDGDLNGTDWIILPEGN